MVKVRLINYNITEVEYKLNPMAQIAKTFKISPKFEFKMQHNANKLNMLTRVEILKTMDGAGEPPFTLCMTVSAMFTVDEAGSLDEMRIAASNCIFPYVRSAIANLTQLSNIPSFHLPLIDFSTPPSSQKIETMPARPSQPQKGGGSVIVAANFEESDEEN